MDYAAFDSFLARETWHTSHPNDLSAFDLVLSCVISDPKFNPDQMAS